MTGPVEKPVPMGYSTLVQLEIFMRISREMSYQITLASLCHDHAFGTGLYVPYCHLKGPFSWMKPKKPLVSQGQYRMSIITFQRRTSRTSVEPNDNIIFASWVDSWKKPVKELGVFGPVLFQINWDLTGVALSNIK